MDRATLARTFMYGKIVDIGCGDALYLWGGNPPKNVTTESLALQGGDG